MLVAVVVLLGVLGRTAEAACPAACDGCKEKRSAIEEEGDEDWASSWGRKRSGSRPPQTEENDYDVMPMARMQGDGGEFPPVMVRKTIDVGNTRAYSTTCRLFFGF